MFEEQGSLRCDYLPGCLYKIWQDANEFCFTTDAVFLGNFPHLVTKAKALELGCGTGAVSMLLASRGAAHVTAVDCNANVTKLLRRSAAANGLEDRLTVVDGDIRDYKALLRPESMDLVAANPPYRNSGNVRRIGTAACHELTATLEDFFKAAAFAVRYRGRFALVQLPDRFAESMQLAFKYGLQPKRLQWVHSAADKPAWIFLMEMVKGGSRGLEVLPPLIMYDKDGCYTEQVKKYYATELPQ
ncbi:MAG: methyltransferase [Phascolarctobacterium sp.]|uniref:tRNA1(Val) (adenine(37)-N6)-methyltransferase n=1 Tax=Phascolarctobacterium sp. TaxID=2049039 RepID=UPI0026DD1EB9|nr:methyltransferase [Phascolarctobacterium sp.]MDO4921808.1 methyltransferase [Phascolarctobacterium sp.]